MLKFNGPCEQAPPTGMDQCYGQRVNRVTLNYGHFCFESLEDKASGRRRQENSTDFETNLIQYK